MPNCFLKKLRLVVLVVVPLASSLCATFSIAHSAGADKAVNKTSRTDSLPNVLSKYHSDLVASRLRNEAALYYSIHPLPATAPEWNQYRSMLKKEIIKRTGVIMHQDLPLDMKETGHVKMQGYTIKNIAFQTRPGIYATANLYVPDGTGTFPAVLVMMGHSREGRFYDKYEAVGQALARNGYVSLCIDPWGAGERTTVHGQYEDHGDENNLGSALMDLGESLMGMELTDNIRGVDLLCSLPYVDAQNVGATGASGGGNQTMWLAAMDERIKAAVPVVSAGTFESYIMGSPCICEVLFGGLTFTEEAGVLALIAPRALKMCNHEQDANAAFNPREMLRSYQNAQPVFRMLGVENNLSYSVFNLTHGYWPEDRNVMLAWFNQYLKVKDPHSTVEEMPFKKLSDEQQMVYASGKRDAQVLSTEAYCKQKGRELRNHFLNTRSFDVEGKRDALRTILKLGVKPVIRKVQDYGKSLGWSRFAIETTDDKLIPVLTRVPSNKDNGFVVVIDPGGKQAVPSDVIDSITRTGSGIALVDLSGTGEAASHSVADRDSIGRFRTISRSYLWLGKTLIGEWVKELSIATHFLQVTYKAQKVSIYGRKEAGLAGLFLSAVEGNIEQVILQDAPVSYLFDKREGVEFYSTGIHLPGFLTWGDISLVAALRGKDTTFINPVTMSGQQLTSSQWKACEAEFEKVRKLCKQTGKTMFKRK